MYMVTFFSLLITYEGVQQKYCTLSERCRGPGSGDQFQLKPNIHILSHSNLDCN